MRERINAAIEEIAGKLHSNTSHTEIVDSDKPIEEPKPNYSYAVQLRIRLPRAVTQEQAEGITEELVQNINNNLNGWYEIVEFEIYEY